MAMKNNVLMKSDNFDAIDPEAVSNTIDKINKTLTGKHVDKKIRQKLSYAKKHWPGNIARYNKQEAQLGVRNSMSKTDPELTFMRMKEDSM